MRIDQIWFQLQVLDNGAYNKHVHLVIKYNQLTMLQACPWFACVVIAECYHNSLPLIFYTEFS